jgi:5'-methylthioadenosine phosphorylase
LIVIDVINMTTVPEAPLVREAGMCYAAIAMSTDYDSWHDSVVDVPAVRVFFL